MSTHRYIDRICLAAALLSLILMLLFVNGTALGLQSADQTMGYEARLFDTARVHTVDIVMEDWENFLDTCEDEAYAACSVVIDGEGFQNVGLRAKGNTSLRTVSSMGSDRYSFKIEFDHYDSGKTYYGLDKLCLNNLIQDNTCMKDYLTYRLMASFGAAAPLCSYVFITVNGQDWGLYLAVEGVEESFLQRNYGSRSGQLYKPDSMNLGGGRGNGQAFSMGDLDFSQAGGGQMPAPPDFTEAEPPQGRPDRAGAAGPGGGMGSEDVKLQYTDDDPDSYANLFENAKTTPSAADQARLIRALKALGQGQVEQAVDVDAVLRYFVVHNFVVNGDSYTGSMVHNYYLYEEDGLLSMIPWDYNLAFGTFQARDAASAVNDPIDTPLSVTGDGDRPMADWIVSSEANTALYHQYFAEFLETADPDALIDEASALISSYVERDPTKFCTLEEFETGVQTLKTFCALRTESVSGQLAGTIPSTTEGQAADPDALVDASGLVLSDLGTMDQGGGGPGDAPRSGGRPDASSREPDRSMAEPFGDSGGDRPSMQMGPAAAHGGPGGDASVSPDTWLLGVSVLALAAGLAAAHRYRRRGSWAIRK